MNYKEAPYSKFHKMLFLCAVLGQIACGFALGIAGTAVTEGMAVPATPADKKTAIDKRLYGTYTWNFETSSFEGI